MTAVVSPEFVKAPHRPGVRPSVRRTGHVQLVTTMTPAELLAHTFSWETAPGVPADPRATDCHVHTEQEES